MDYWGEEGGGQRECWPPPLKLLPPPSSYAYHICHLKVVLGNFCESPANDAAVVNLKKHKLYRTLSFCVLYYFHPEPVTQIAEFANSENLMRLEPP